MSIYVTLYTKEHGILNLTEDEWWQFDFSTVTRHRDDGPSAIYYYRDGTINSEYHSTNNMRHRTDGPAIFIYNKDGTLKNEYYYINDKRYLEEDYWKEITILNNKSNILKMVE